jgi:hypothetical protein
VSDQAQWWTYVQGQLDRLGWNTMDFERESGISRTRLVDWKKGKGVTVEIARQVADAFGQPILTVLVSAGLLTPEEAKQRAAAPVDPAKLTDDELLAEVRRRMLASRAPTAEDVAANPARYTVLGKGQTTPKRRKTGP